MPETVSKILRYFGKIEETEAVACELAFKACKDRLEEILLGSFSGQYLIEHRLKKDVEHAARFNYCDVVPGLRNSKIECLS